MVSEMLQWKQRQKQISQAALEDPSYDFFFLLLEAPGCPDKDFLILIVNKTRPYFIQFGKSVK